MNIFEKLERIVQKFYVTERVHYFLPIRVKKIYEKETAFTTFSFSYIFFFIVHLQNLK